MSSSPGEVGKTSERVLGAVSAGVVGKRHELKLILTGMLADGHILIEDLPGLGKTLIARTFAGALGLEFKRIQFTPDLMPSDVTGAFIYNQAASAFEFRPGPIFTNLLLADEINRAPAKTQAALLEAMQERQVTIEGETHRLDRPFLVIATQNPIEFEGTYPLPEAQLDRFILRLSLGYSGEDEEVDVLDQRVRRRQDEPVIQRVVSKDELLGMQAALEEVHVARALMHYIVRVVAATRSHPKVQVGASPRGALAVMKLARAWAALDGRPFATPDDVKVVAVVALSHRLTLKPEHWIQNLGTDELVREAMEGVPTPTVAELTHDR